MEQELEQVNLSPEEQQEVISDLCDFAQRSNNKFANDYEKIKQDRELFSSTCMWDANDKKLFTDRNQAEINILPKYSNAICNSFREHPFQTKILNDKEGKISELIKQIELDSDSDSLWASCLKDTVTTGLAFAYVTTENGKLKMNYAYDSLLVIQDPGSIAVNGKDSTEIAFVEKKTYNSLKEMYPDIDPQDRLLTSKTSNLGSMWSSTKDLFNLITYFKKVGNDVNFYKILGNTVLSFGTFTNLSSIPATPVKGEEFWYQSDRYYKGIVRGCKDAIRIINFSYSQLEDRLTQPSLPYDSVSARAIEGFETDYDNTNKAYKRYNDIDIENKSTIQKPEHVTPEIRSGDLLTIITDSKKTISEIIGVPESGLIFQSNAQQTATEVIARSKSTVNNISHYYQHLKASIRQLTTVMVEILCEYNQIENTFTVDVTEGPEILLQKENLRQQLVATSSFVPEVAKPLIMAEIIRTLDFPNSEAVADAVLQTLPENIRPTNKNVASLQTNLLEVTNQNKQLVEQLQQAMDKTKQLQQSIDLDVVGQQNQRAMLKEQHDNAIKLKLLDMDIESKKMQQDLMLKLAEASSDNKVAITKALQDQQKIDIENRKLLLDELEASRNSQPGVVFRR